MAIRLLKWIGIYLLPVFLLLQDYGDYLNSLHEIDDVPDEVKKVFITANRVSPERHVKIQSAFQQYTDNAVSKTVNFPHDASRDGIAEVLSMANEYGLKGITVCRDQSRDLQPLCTGEEGIELVRQRFGWLS